MDFSIPAPFPSVTPPTDDEQNETVAASGATDINGISDMDLDGLSDASSVSETVDFDLCMGLASSAREDGNNKLREGDVDGATAMYERAIKELKKMSSCIDDDLIKKSSDMRLACYLNLSLCNIKKSSWREATKAASKALKLDDQNIKALFRRGVAQSRAGWLEEARVDLLRAYKFDPTNVEVRKELAEVKKKEVEAKRRDKEAFAGLFARSAAGLYDDREAQLREQKRLAAEKEQQEMREYESEQKEKEAKGEPVVSSFEEWCKQKKERLEKEAKEKEEQERKQRAQQKKSSSASNGGSIQRNELDDEDLKILDETKKMGYCYFDRPAPDKEKRPRAEQPQRLESPLPSQSSTSSKALSSWNSQGTTYEEKDCSNWAKATITDLFKGVSFESSSPTHESSSLQQLVSESSPPSEEAYKVAASFLPMVISVIDVSNVGGDAQITVIRASRRYLYDIHFDLKFTVKVSGLPEVLTPFLEVPSSQLGSSFEGTASFTDVCSTTSDGRVEWLDDARISWKAKPTAQLYLQGLQLAVRQLKEAVHRKINSFEEAFRALV